jgi:hypothetical protein
MHAKEAVLTNMELNTVQVHVTAGVGHWVTCLDVELLIQGACLEGRWCKVVMMCWLG